MSKEKESTDMQSYGKELDAIVKELLNVPVTSKEWDLKVKRYNELSYKMSQLSGKMITCDMIIY